MPRGQAEAQNAGWRGAGDECLGSGGGDACRHGGSGGGRCTVDPGRHGGKKVRARPSERDATRRAAPSRARLGNMAYIGRPCARRGNVAVARPSRTPGDPTNTHGCTENGGPEKERIPFCRARGDEKRRGENERARTRQRKTDE